MNRLSRLLSKNPSVKPIPFSSDTVFGIKIDDPYRWLHELRKPEVLQYIHEENSYFEQYFERGAIRKYISNVTEEFEEMSEEGDDISTPELSNGYFYYVKNETLFCRRKGSMASPEQVFLDINKERNTCVDVKFPKISPDQKRFAFAYQRSARAYHRVCKLILLYFYEFSNFKYKRVVLDVWKQEKN